MQWQRQESVRRSLRTAPPRWLHCCENAGIPCQSSPSASSVLLKISQMGVKSKFLELREKRHREEKERRAAAHVESSRRDRCRIMYVCIHRHVCIHVRARTHAHKRMNIICDASGGELLWGGLTRVGMQWQRVGADEWGWKCRRRGAAPGEVGTGGGGVR
jgi:hypothetical protein